MIVDISARTPIANVGVLETINRQAEQLGWGRIAHCIPVDGVPRQGAAATSYVDEAGETINVPARGQVGMAYFRVRLTTRTIDEITAAFDFAALGVDINTPTVVSECDDVLGAWA